METVDGLDQFSERGAGTDAERRAARWLARRLGSNGDDTLVETFWSRPNWALGHTWHAAPAVAGSLVSVASPVAGIAMLAVAMVAVLTDELAGVSLGRRLTPERASQNVIVVPAARDGESAEPVRLLITANYDAARTGLAYRTPIRRAAGRIRRALRSVTPGWLGWMVIAITWLLAIAVLRLEGDKSHAIGVIQLPPTVGLVLGFALLLELATAGWSPSAGDNGTGVGVALALASALRATPPRHLAVELVLTGAGDRDQLGLRRYLRARRRERRAANTVVLGIGACGGGHPRWWSSDGALVPLRYARTLRRLAERITAEEPHLGVRPHRGRGTTPALPARRAGIPAVTIGCLDDCGLAPRAHQSADAVSQIDIRALERALQFALLMVDAIDATVGEARAQPSPTPA